MSSSKMASNPINWLIVRCKMIKLKSYEIFNSESTENLKVSKCIHKNYNKEVMTPWGITICPL